jgi:glycerol kinase
MTKPYVGALDQGTTSTRFIVFDADGREVARHQLEHRQILTRPGWVEHDPVEIIAHVVEVIAGALRTGGVTCNELAAIGIANQRETTVVWNPRSGEPWHNAIVWQDIRTDEAVTTLKPRHAFVRERTGLPAASYFSAIKLQWILDHVDHLRERAERGDALFGTIDSWIIWNLTGGIDGGLHVTDATNASRTQLMNLHTLDWDEELLSIFRVPRRMLPRICPSSHRSAFGATRADGPLGAEVPIAGNLGDQHAALVGQACFDPGTVKNTYGTGNFILLNTGALMVTSSSGLITTLGYALQEGPPAFALEGSVAVTGSAVQWLRDQLGVIESAAEIEPLAGSVADSAGLFFVPAFSGLFAPYWRPDARGVIAGLTRFHTRAHLAQATLEAICFQTRAVLDAMVQDSRVEIASLKVDGGATANNLLMQRQADILGLPVVRPVISETTALGAAYAAGLAVGLWPDIASVRRQWKADRQWEPSWSPDRRDAVYDGWRKAVDRAVGWVDHSEPGSSWS